MMYKYNKRIVKRICDLIAKDAYTIAEICQTVKISESCFYNWQSTIVEFGEAVQKAREQFDELLVREAKNSLRKMVLGYTVDETKTVYEPASKSDPTAKPKIREQTITKKHIQPNVAATIFLLTNKASEEYKNRLNNEVTGKDGKDLFTRLTDEELDKKIADMQAKLKP